MTSLITAGIVVLIFGAVLWAALRSARRVGALGETAANLKKGQEAENARRNVEAVVGAADVVEHRRMRDRWTRN